MKKILAILLAVLLICSVGLLTGCSSADTLEKKVEAGEEVLIGFIVVTLGPEMVQSIANYITDTMAGYGCTVQTVDAQMDNTKYISAIENFITQGADAIAIIPLDTSGIQDICKKAMEEGIYIVMLSTKPVYEVSGGLMADYVTCAEVCCDMTLSWVRDHYKDAPGDSVGVLVSGGELPVEYLQAKEAIIDIMDKDKTTYFSFKSGAEVGMVDTGYTLCEQALTADPDIRVFVSNCDPDGAVGMNNYLLTVKGIDLADYCITVVNQDETTIKLIDASKAGGESAIRGLIGFGGEQPGVQICDVLYKLLSGEEKAPFWEYDPIYTYNALGWEYKAA